MELLFWVSWCVFSDLFGWCLFRRGSDTSNTTIDEPVNHGAGDFKVPGGFSELNKEVGFAQYEDSLGQTITITKLDNQTDYMDTWFTNMSYTTHAEIVKPAVETDIDNLYSVDVISDLDWVRGYVELVEFKGDRYIVQVNEYENLYDKGCPLAFMYDLVQDMEYINKENKLTPIKVI